MILDMCAFGYTMQYQQTVKTEWLVKKGVLEWACKQHQTQEMQSMSGEGAPGEHAGGQLRLRVNQGGGGPPMY